MIVEMVLILIIIIFIAGYLVLTSIKTELLLSKTSSVTMLGMWCKVDLIRMRKLQNLIAPKRSKEKDAPKNWSQRVNINKSRFSLGEGSNQKETTRETTKIYGSRNGKKSQIIE